MSSLSLRLPDSLHRNLRALAERENISINQFIATAVAEKAAALLTVEYLEQRGGRANTKVIDSLLARVPDVPPIPGDELPRKVLPKGLPPSALRNKGSRTSKVTRRPRRRQS